MCLPETNPESSADCCVCAECKNKLSFVLKWRVNRLLCLFIKLCVVHFLHCCSVSTVVDKSPQTSVTEMLTSKCLSSNDYLHQFHSITAVCGHLTHVDTTGEGGLRALWSREGGVGVGWGMGCRSSPP